MDFDDVRFNKRDRFAVTDGETQISAAEWNALGMKVREMDANSMLFEECAWNDQEYEEYPKE